MESWANATLSATPGERSPQKEIKRSNLVGLRANPTASGMDVTLVTMCESFLVCSAGVGVRFKRVAEVGEVEVSAVDGVVVAVDLKSCLG